MIFGARKPEVRGIRFRRNYGKSAALHVGFQAAKGEVVVTMDADLQDSPEEIPELRRMILEDRPGHGFGLEEENDTTRSPKPFPANFTTGRPAK